MSDEDILVPNSYNIICNNLISKNTVSVPDLINIQRINGQSYPPPVGVNTVIAPTSATDQNGAIISALNLNMEFADGTHNGIISAGTQTIGGTKTFAGGIVSPTLTGVTTINGNQYPPIQIGNISNTYNFTGGPFPLIATPLVSGTSVSGFITFCIFATDGVDFQSQIQSLYFNAINKGNVLSHDVSEVGGTSTNTSGAIATIVTFDLNSGILRIACAITAGFITTVNVIQNQNIFTSLV